MDHHHEHRAPEPTPFGLGEWPVPVLLVCLLTAYLVAVLILRERGTRWPMTRTLAWLGGLLLVGAGLVGPLAERAHHDFVAHMAGHVLLGMLGPLFLVLAAPATLALRVLPLSTARRLSRLLASPPATFLTNPFVAALLNIGGLWALYRTGLYTATHTEPLLIVLAVISSIANLRNVTNAARLAGKTLLWFAITALVSVAIAIALGLTIRPGLNSAVDAGNAAEPTNQGSWLAFIESLVPANFLGLAASTSATDDGGLSTSLSFNVLQLIVIAVVLGIAAVKVGKPAEPFIAFTESTLQVVLKALWWVIRLAPIGTVGLLGNAVYSYGWTTIGALGQYTVTIYVGLALVLFVVYPIVAAVNGLSPAKYFSGVWPAVQLGFVSRSSMGTLPVTQRVTEQNLGVPRYYSAFAVPFGATTKMDGCAAIYPAISAIFVAQFFGIDLAITDYLLIVFVSVIGSAATAGTTGATVMLTLTLSTVGLPLEGVGLLLAVDPILDMGRTAVNVAGQALVPAIVAKRESILDVTRYNAPRGATGFVPLDEPGTLSAQEQAAEAATEEAEERAPEVEHTTAGSGAKG